MIQAFLYISLLFATSCQPGGGSNEEIISDLLSPDANIRAQATSEAYMRGNTAAITLPYLIDLLAKDPVPSVRQGAARAIAGVDGTAPTALRALTSAVSDPQIAVRKSAVEALGLIGPAAQSSLSTLFAAANEYWQVRAIMQMTLAAVTPDRVEEIQAKFEPLEKETWQLHLATVDALSRISPASEPVIFLVAQTLESADAAGQLQALKVLEKMGAAAIRTRKSIEVFLTNTDPLLRTQAAISLGAIGAKESVPALIKLLGDRSTDVRRGAGAALRQLDTPQARDVLNARYKEALPGLSDKNSTVRRNSARALDELGTKQALETLKEHRRFYPDD